jgi:hypothetical protein
MPKLDKIQIADRLRARLEDLRNGKEVAARDLRALLTDAQILALEAAWSKQQTLRKKKRARTKEEEQTLGWRSKREIQIEVIEQFLNEADDRMLETYIELQKKQKLGEHEFIWMVTAKLEQLENLKLKHTL